MRCTSGIAIVWGLFPWGAVTGCPGVGRWRMQQFLLLFRRFLYFYNSEYVRGANVDGVKNKIKKGPTPFELPEASAVTVPVRRHGPRRMKPRPCFLLSSQQQASTNARKLTTADKMQGFLRYNRVHRCTGYFWWAYRSYRSFEYRYRVRAEPYQSVR